MINPENILFPLEPVTIYIQATHTGENEHCPEDKSVYDKIVEYHPYQSCIYNRLEVCFYRQQVKIWSLILMAHSKDEDLTLL